MHSLIYILISLCVILPVSIVGLNYAVNTVHKAQQEYKISPADVSINSSGYEKNSVSSGKAELKKVNAGDKIGDLFCLKAGLSTPVYLGFNRASMRYGAGLYIDGGMPGYGRRIDVGAYSNGSFAAIDNIKKGDEIVFETSWGIYEYKVTEIKTAEAVELNDNKELLVLRTQKSKNAFSAYNSNQLFVIAEKLSGPTAEEVHE